MSRRRARLFRLPSFSEQGAFKTDLSKEKAPLLHDPDVTIKLIEANAVSGFAAKDVDGDGKIDLRGKDKMGITCSMCHTVVDGSVYRPPPK